MRLRARDVLRGRLPRPSDDRGNIAMLLMVILVGATIGSLLLTMIINQNSSTRFDASRVRSLDAAQAGIDVMLGQIRDATSTGTDGKTFGNSDALPCSAVSGTVNASGTMTYSVSVAYYSSDPAKGATPMTCAPNNGPYNSLTGAHTPRYAKITSFGVDSANPNSASKGRTLSTTYIFQTDDVNIPGGEIQLPPDGSGNKWCMDAGSATPAPGTTVVLRACSTSLPPAAQQVFAYRSDLSVQLVSSVTTAQPTGLCLDTSPTTHASGDAIVLNACNAPGTAAWNQQWSVNDNAQLEGSVANPQPPNSGRDGYCITAASQTNMQALTLISCGAGAPTWVPAATAGAGGAGAANHNIVNYQNFGTCIDVTGGVVTSTFLILYSCKTNPVETSPPLRWNQVFAQALGPPSLTAGPLTSTLAMAPDNDSGSNYGNTYCLQDPGTAGAYVTVSSACSSTWTWYQTKDSSGKSLPYAQVYTITDSAGLCLSPGPSTDMYAQYLKIIVTTCDGGTDQKWNADPSVLASRLTNTGEK